MTKRETIQWYENLPDDARMKLHEEFGHDGVYDRETKFYQWLKDSKQVEKKEILNTYKWIKVKKYIDDESLTWQERYKALEKHHIEETNFLINKVREIIKCQ